MAAIQGLALAGGKRGDRGPDARRDGERLARRVAPRRRRLRRVDRCRASTASAAMCSSRRTRPRRRSAFDRVARGDRAEGRRARKTPPTRSPRWRGGRAVTIVGDSGGAVRGSLDASVCRTPASSSLPITIAAAAVRLAAGGIGARRVAACAAAVLPAAARRRTARANARAASAGTRAATAGSTVGAGRRGADDLGRRRALQRRTFTNPWGAEAIRWELENTDVARLYVVRAAGGALVAYCACWMVFDELHINSLAVDDPVAAAGRRPSAAASRAARRRRRRRARRDARGPPVERGGARALRGPRLPRRRASGATTTRSPAKTR